MLFRSARGVAASVTAVFVAEFVLFVALASQFGVMPVSLVAILGSIVGLRYLFRIAPGLVARSYQDLAESVMGRSSADHSSNRPIDQTMADRALQVLGAALLAFPGLLTGAVGSVLLVGPARALVAPSLGSRLSSLLPAGALSGRSSARRGDVFDATSTIKDPARPPESTTWSGPALSEAPGHDQS